MTYPNWREPAKLLRVQLRPVTPEQLTLAQHVGVKIGKRTPSRVAAAMLQDHLGDLLARSVRDISCEQTDLLQSLSVWKRGGDG